MRRRVLWIGGILAGAVALFVAFALVFRSYVPFDFLEGREEMELDAAIRKGALIEDVRIYCFKGDYDSIAERAKPELLASGYKDLTAPTDMYSEMYAIGAWENYLRLPSRKTAQGVSFVRLYRDMRVDSEYEWSVDQPGWVVVHISGEPPGGLFERFRRWMGL